MMAGLQRAALIVALAMITTRVTGDFCPSSITQAFIDGNDAKVSEMRCSGSRCDGEACTAAAIAGENCDIFLKGDFIELGVHSVASFGTKQSTPSSGNQACFAHRRGSRRGSQRSQLGFIADYGKDGWAQPSSGNAAFAGGYFVPGSPVEGWVVQYNVGSPSGSQKRYVHKGLSDRFDTKCPVNYMEDTSSGTELSMAWSCRTPEGLEISKVVKFEKNSLYFTVAVTMKNAGSNTLANLHYMRTLDPDQEQPWTGRYGTRNWVEFQPDGATDLDLADIKTRTTVDFKNPDPALANSALVVATAQTQTDLYLGLSTVNQFARVGMYGFNNKDPTVPFKTGQTFDSTDFGGSFWWEGRSSGPYTEASPYFRDGAIQIAFRFGTGIATSTEPLGPGASVDFSYAFILGKDDLAPAAKDTSSLNMVVPTDGTAKGSSQIFEIKVAGASTGDAVFFCGTTEVGRTAAPVAGTTDTFRVRFDTATCATASSTMPTGEGAQKKFVFKATMSVDGKVRSVSKLVNIIVTSKEPKWEFETDPPKAQYTVANGNTAATGGIKLNGIRSPGTPSTLVNFLETVFVLGQKLPTRLIACWCETASSPGCRSSCTVGDDPRLVYDFSPYLKGTTLTLDAQFGTDPSALLTHTVPIKIDELNVAPTDIQVNLGGAVQPTPSLNENVAANTVLFTLSAVDINAADTHTYQITSCPTVGSESGCIFKVSGDTLLVDAPADFETSSTKTRTIGFRVTDAATPTNNTFDKDIQFTIVDVNEAPTLNTATFNVAENAFAPGGPAFVVADLASLVSDPDAGDSVELQLTTTDSGRFEIEVGTTTLKLKKPLDFETQTTHTVQLRARDSALNIDEKTITINVDDVNEQPSKVAIAPGVGLAGIVNECKTEFNPTISHDCSHINGGEVIAKLASTDVDAGQTLTYSMSANDFLQLNAATGEITLKTGARLDFETLPLSIDGTARVVQLLGVTATDNGTPVQSSASVDIEIKVVDVKEVARVDLPCGGVCRIREDVEKDALVTTVVAEAATAETKVEFSFAADGNPNDTFFIHPCSGNVFLKSSTPLDFEGAQKTTPGEVPEDPKDSQAQPGFTLKVVVTTEGVPKTVSFNLVLQNVNEPPKITPATVTIDENPSVDFAVHSMVFTDPDSGSAGYTNPTFEIKDGDPNGLFKIDSATGDIKVAKGAPAIDFESGEAHTLTIRATDSQAPTADFLLPKGVSVVSQLFADAQVTVNINNLNEAPKFDPADNKRKISENSANGTPLIGGSIRAGDEDKDQEASLNYSIQTAGTPFSIDPVTGVLSVNGVINFEAQNTWTVKVRATDNGILKRANGVVMRTVSGKQDEIDIEIEVLDVNEQPSFKNLPPGGDLLFELKENEAESTSLIDSTTTLTTTGLAPAGGGGTVYVEDPDVGAADPSWSSLEYSLVDATGTFTIDATTGLLRTSKSLNFEKQKSFAITIQVTDGETPVVSQSATVTVIDVNETPVLLVNPPGSIKEDAGAGTIVTARPESPDHFLIRGTDDDNTDGLTGAETLTFSITDGDPTGAWELVPESATLNSAAPITKLRMKNAGDVNFEAKPTWTLKIKLEDSNGLSVEQDYVVSVVNRNDAPALTATTLNVGENARIATAPNVGAVLAAVDEDAGCIDEPCNAAEWGDVSFSITAGNDGNVFSIENAAANTAQLKLNPTALGSNRIKDMNSGKRRYDLTVQVTDRNGATTTFKDPATGEDLPAGISSTATITVELTEQNDPPVMTCPPSLAIDENSAVNTDAGQITSVDPEGHEIFYSFVSGNDLDAFRIEATAAGTIGNIKVDKNIIDHETKAQYDLTIEAKDDQTPPLSSSCTIVLSVTDLNEDPVLPDASRAINENALPGDTVGDVLVGTDVDAGTALEYTIVAGNLGNAFAFDPTPGSGQIVVATGADIDFEARPSYDLTVRVTDNGKPGVTPRSTDAKVVVTVRDKNEEPTIADVETRSVTENAARGTPASPKVNIADPDFGQTHAFTIADNAGNTQPAFAGAPEIRQVFVIDATTGLIRVNVDANELNFEAKDKYELEVTVTDVNPPGVNSTITDGLTDTKTIIVNVIDANEQPTFTAATKSAVLEVNENSAGGVTVGAPLEATDPDTKSVDVARRTLNFAVPASETTFDVDATTGQLSLRPGSINIDFETKSSYSVVVTVSDAGSPSLSETHTFIVNVKDVNEAPTAALFAGTSYKVKENSATGTLVSKFSCPGLSACDPDTTGTFTDNKFTILSAIPASGTSAFTFDGVGNLNVDGTLNFETHAESGGGGVKEYKLTVEIADVANPALSATGEITVSVEDVNEKPVYPNCVRKIDENSAVNAPACNNITLTTPGDLKPCGCVASDVDRTPSGETQTLIYSIEEQRQCPTPSTCATITDNIFQINPCTGVVAVKDPVLNFEGIAKLYELRVKVTDDGGEENKPLSDEAIITVHVEDINEAPVISASSQSVNENSLTGSEFGTTMKNFTFDEDNGGSKDAIFNVTDGEGFGIFDVNPTTGKLFVTTAGAAQLNFEVRDLYTMIVRAADAADASLFTETTVTVNVNDMNEDPVMDAYVLTVAEKRQEVVTVLPRVTLNGGEGLRGSDVDAGQVLTYSIASVDPPVGASTFEIDRATGVLTVDPNVLDHEAQSSYTLNITATDNGRIASTGEIQPTRANTASTIVRVLDRNEKPTAADPSGCDVSENSIVSTFVCKVTTVDVDANQTINYRITSPSGLNEFSIDADGSVRVNQDNVLDFESKKSYSFVVTATDTGTDPKDLQDTATVAVTLIDVNEPPIVDEKLLRFNVNENANSQPRQARYCDCSVRLVGSAQAAASDPDEKDAGKLTFAWEASSPFQSVFAIDSNTGAITIRAGQEVDFETTIEYALNVTVTDSGWEAGKPALSTTAPVTIKVNDVPEEPALNVSLIPTFKVPEFSINGTSFGQALNLFAEDSDSPHNSLRYKLDDSDKLSNPKTKEALDLFEIDAETGQMRVKATCGAVCANSATAGSSACQSSVCTTSRFNQTQKHEVRVIITDKAGLGLQSTPTLINIEVTDQNFAPKIDDSAAVIDENSVVGTVLSKLTATDADNDPLTFALVASDPGIGFDTFAVDGATGDLTVGKAIVDFETHNSYKLTVSAFDGELLDTAIVTVTINDLQERPTISNAGGVKRIVRENEPASIVAPSILAADEDAADANKLVYTLAGARGQGGFDFAPFEIDADTGAIRTNATLNFERLPKGSKTFTFDVTVKDAGGPLGAGNELSVTKQVVIDVSDVNEPVTVKAGQSFAVDEDDDGTKHPARASLGAIFATDKDFEEFESAGCQEKCGLRYSIAACGDAGRPGGTETCAPAGGTPPACCALFEIDGRTGEFFKAAGAAFDFEATPAWAVVVAAEDNVDWGSEPFGTLPVGVLDDPTTFQAQQRDSKTVIVRVIDANDASVTSIDDGASNSNNFDTAGAERVLIKGTNLGPSSSNQCAEPANTAVTAKYRRGGVVGGSGPVYSATACKVNVANTELECKTAAGVGTDMQWQVTITTSYSASCTAFAGISNQSIAVVVPTQVTSYRPPRIDANGVTFSSGTLMPTTAGTKITVTGSSFGPLDATTPVTLFYVPKDRALASPGGLAKAVKAARDNGAYDATGAVTTAQAALAAEAGGAYTAAKCKVTIAHTTVECESVEGVGHTLIWAISAGGQDSVVHNSTLAHNKPAIDDVSPTSLGTLGAETITFTGTNFGPAAGAVPRTTLQYSNGLYSYVVGGPNPGCTVTKPHTEVQCSAAPGVGKDHVATLTIGDQSSAPATTKKISYRLPTVTDAKLLGGSRKMETKGGQVLVIDGTDMGPPGRCTGGNREECRDVRTNEGLSACSKTDCSGGKAAGCGGDSFTKCVWTVNTDVAAFYGPVGSATEYHATSCAVHGSTHTQIRCNTTEGTGKNYVVAAQVGKQDAPATTTPAQAISYIPPVLVRLAPSWNDKGAQTPGDELITIVGEQFGPAGSSNIDNIWYGNPDNAREKCLKLNLTGNIACESTLDFEAVGCTVTKAHEEIQCKTNEGAGLDHKWVLKIDGQFSLSPTTAYHVPQVQTFSGATAASMGGGEIITLSGLNFGPPAGSHVTTGVPFLESVAYGPAGQLDKYVVTERCTVVDHDQLECKLIEGFGAELFWTVRIAGQVNVFAQHPKPAPKYADPLIFTILPSVAGTDALSSAQKVVLEGSNFGPPGVKTVVLFGPKNPSTCFNAAKSIPCTKTVEPIELSDVSVFGGSNRTRFEFALPEGVQWNVDNAHEVDVTIAVGHNLPDEQRSAPITFTYEPPLIEATTVREAVGSADLDLVVEGLNFGIQAAAELHIVPSNKYSQTEVDNFIAANDVAGLANYLYPRTAGDHRSTTGRDVQWSHTRVTTRISYTPEGYVWVQVADRKSIPVLFRNLDPIVFSKKTSDSYIQTKNACAEKDATGKPKALGDENCNFFEFSGDGSFTVITRAFDPAGLPTEGGGTLRVVGRNWGPNPSLYIMDRSFTADAKIATRCSTLFGATHAANTACTCKYGFAPAFALNDPSFRLGSDPVPSVMQQLQCQLPPGQGLTGFFVRSEAGQNSDVYPLRYENPAIVWENTTNAYAQDKADPFFHTDTFNTAIKQPVVMVPTRGGEITIHGEHLGFFDQDIEVSGTILGPAATNTWSRLAKVDNSPGVAGEHRTIKVNVPAGEGADNKLTLIAAGQRSNEVSLQYAPPVGTRLDLRSGDPLAANWFDVDLIGTNFGDDSSMEVAFRHTATLFLEDGSGANHSMTAVRAVAHEKLEMTSPIDLATALAYGARIEVDISGQTMEFSAPKITHVRVVELLGNVDPLGEGRAATSGGQKLHVVAEHVPANVTVNVTVAGKPCTGARRIDEQRNASAVIECEVPAGEGAEVDVQVRAGWLYSLPGKMSYRRPSVRWSEFEVVGYDRPSGTNATAAMLEGDTCQSLSLPTNLCPPTRGAKVTVKGEDFGLAAQVLICPVGVNAIATPAKCVDIDTDFANVRCPGTSGCGILSRNHTELVLNLPAWDGSDHTFNVVVAGQNASRQFAYALPRIDNITCATPDPAWTCANANNAFYLTQGGSKVALTGANFGFNWNKTTGPVTQGTGTTVAIGPFGACSVTQYSETSLTCVLPEGDGTINAVVRVGGDDAQSGKQKFRYTAPEITFVSALSASTAGVDFIDMVGTNFGRFPQIDLGDVYIDAAGKSHDLLRSNLTLASHNHTHVRWRVPEDHGFGGGRPITLIQNPGSNPGLLQHHTYGQVFTYSAPRIDSWVVNTRDRNPELPTSGCVGLPCEVNPLLLTITGDSFGIAILNGDSEPRATTPADIRAFDIAQQERTFANRLSDESLDFGRPLPRTSKRLFDWSDPTCARDTRSDCAYDEKRTVQVRIYHDKHANSGTQLLNGAFEPDCDNLQSDLRTCGICEVIEQSHRRIVCKPGGGTGRDLKLRVERRQGEAVLYPACSVNRADTGGVNLCAQSNVQSLSYRKPSVVQVDPTQVDAKGGQQILLVGDNLGPWATDVEILIGGKICTEASWYQPWLGPEGVRAGPGRRCSVCANQPYLACRVPRDGCSSRFKDCSERVCVRGCKDEDKIDFGKACEADDKFCNEMSAQAQISASEPIKVCPQSACIDPSSPVQAAEFVEETFITEGGIYNEQNRQRACELDNSCRLAPADVVNPVTGRVEAGDGNSGLTVGWKSLEVKVARQAVSYAPQASLELDQRAGCDEIDCSLYNLNQTSCEAVTASAIDDRSVCEFVPPFRASEPETSLCRKQARCRGTERFRQTLYEDADLNDLNPDKIRRDPRLLQTCNNTNGGCLIEAVCVGGSRLGGDGFYGAVGERCSKCPPGGICYDSSRDAFDWNSDWPAVPLAKQGFFQGTVEFKPCDANDAECKSDFEEGLRKCAAQIQDTVANSAGGAAGAPRATNDDEQVSCPLFLPCEPKEACLQGNECAPGYAKTRCAFCADGYFKLSGECIECPSCPVCLLIFVFAFLIFCAVAGYILAKKRINLCMLTIGVDYFQVLSLLVQSNRINWPPELRRFFQYLGVFNLNLDLMAPECSLKNFTYIKKWICIQSLPILFMSIFLLFHFAVWAKKKFIQKRTKKLHNHAHLVIGLSAATFYYLYLYISKTILDVFNCAPTDPPDFRADGTEAEYLEVVFEDCKKPGGTRLTLLPFAIIAFCVYSMGFPVLVGLIVLKNAKRIQIDQKLRAVHHVEGTELGEMKRQLRNKHCWNFRKRFHRLYYHYKPEFYYWIMVILARKFCIATAGLVFRKSPVFLMSIILVILFCSYALQMRNNPYMSVSEMEKVALAYEAEKALMSEFEEEKEKKNGKTRRMRMGSRDSVAHRVLLRRAEKRQQSALLYFWNYNTMESTLLFSAVLVVLCGLMFQSEQIQNKGNWATGLFYLTLVIIVVSVSYFFLIFTSEILIAFGYTTSCQKKKLAAAQEKQLRKQSAGHGIDMGLNPLHVDASQRNTEVDQGAILQSKQDLEEAQETIQRMQEELKSIKQERKKAELDSMGSFKSRGRNASGGNKARMRSAPSKKKVFGTKQMDVDGRSRGDTLEDAGRAFGSGQDAPSALPIVSPPGASSARKKKETRVSLAENPAGEV